MPKTILLLCLLGFVTTLAFTSDRQSPLYKNPKATVEARTRDLLARMTLKEKIAQMSQKPLKEILTDGQPDSTKIEKVFKGSSVGTLESPFADIKTVAAAINTTQEYLVTKTRLGIPALPVAETIHGDLAQGATIFPQAIALGSTWNPELIQSTSGVIASEASAIGVRQALAPDLDLGREPRWGRVEETYSEDPYLVSRMGVAYIKGMQGTGDTVDENHMLCTAKHFAAHGSPASGLNLAPVAGGLRDLYSLYLPPFKAAVQEANVRSVMNCYSEFDGVPAAASHLLLTEVLREQWNFKGYVYADYGSVGMLASFQHTAADEADAARQALNAGIDLEAPDDETFKHLEELVTSGRISIAQIDQAVSRILRAKFLAGVFDHPYVISEPVIQRVHTSSNIALARKVAQESIILLKNQNGLLPLSSNLRSIAVIGPNADQVQFGDFSSTNQNKFGVTVLEGIKNAVSSATQVIYAKGCELTGSGKEGFREAVAAAQRSEVAVVVVGGSSSILSDIEKKTEPSTCGEGYDVNDLALTGMQEELVKAIKGTGVPAIVVLVHGRPATINWMKDNVSAILEAWYPGEQGGNAVADILFGKVNPSGKLPISIPQSTGHIPAYYNYKPSDRGYYKKPGTSENSGRDYVFSSPAPLFSFGYGLSYTSFTYSDLQISPEQIKATGEVSIQIKVSNVGKVAGQEVVQVYVRDMVSSVTTPIKQLVAFQKISLQPGESKTVRFILKPDSFALFNNKLEHVVEPGDFKIMVGSASDDIRLEKIIRID